MSLQLSIQIAAAVSAALIAIVVVARQRLGELKAASWLVIWGALILATGHPLFAIAFTLPLEGIADELRIHAMPLLVHARTHFYGVDPWMQTLNR